MNAQYIGCNVHKILGYENLDAIEPTSSYLQWDTFEKKKLYICYCFCSSNYLTKTIIYYISIKRSYSKIHSQISKQTFDFVTAFQVISFFQMFLILKRFTHLYFEIFCHIEISPHLLYHPPALAYGLNPSIFLIFLKLYHFSFYFLQMYPTKCSRSFNSRFSNSLSVLCSSGTSSFGNSISR